MGSLHQCLDEKRYHQFIYLVRLRSNVDELDDKLHTPLIKICSSMDHIKLAKKLIKVLIENGASTDVEDEEGLSLLHIASKKNKAWLVTLLLKLLPDVPANTTDVYGNTPLHYASSHEEVNIVSQILPLLLRYKVNIDRRNQLGFTPLLIAASNGRLEVARYIASKAKVSLTVYDSLYFTSVENWFKIYFDWSPNEKLLSPKTTVVRKDPATVQVQKNNLVPVSTRPAVNSLLDSFSRNTSAIQPATAHSSRQSRIPKIVVTKPSSDDFTRKRPRTAPLRQHNIGKTVKPLKASAACRQHNSKENWINLSMPNSLSSSFPITEKRKQTGPDFDGLSNYTKVETTCWGSMVELANISSEQLSQSYRKTITPIWLPPPTEKEDSPPIHSKPSKIKDGSKAASILLGMIGKSRRAGSECSTVADDDLTSPKANLKNKMLRYGLRRGVVEKKAEYPEESDIDRERVEKAAAILNRVMYGKAAA